MTDTEIWIASFVIGSLASFAYTQALPRVEASANWSRRTQIFFGVVMFLVTSAAGHIVSKAYFGASSAAMKTVRTGGQIGKAGWDDLDDRIDQIEGR
ncbi:hypothetical protein ACIGGE_13625 [Qipengyuania sp. NPDC077410]|uniref:hypothetical protein n=1 Tax=Qipengyuania sp. NPDC077410 TaxID=3364496 RepID=UPI0037CAA773